MRRRLPVLPPQHRICVICEGDEEYDYMERLKSLKVWNAQYEVLLDPAGGNGNIPARYQDRYQNGSCDVIFIFCDTDKKPYEQYEDIKKKICGFHGAESAADEILIYGNPCTLQIVLLHWADVRLKSSAKKVNAPLIEQLTGIQNYKGRADQRKQMMEQITEDSYKKMRERVRKLEKRDTVTGSSNFDHLLDYLSSEDASWIDAINDKLLEF